MRIGDFSVTSVASLSALLVAALACVSSSSQTISQNSLQNKAPEARQGFNLFSLEQEIDIGRNSVIIADKHLALLSDDKVNEYINRLAQPLIERAPAPGFPYSFKVIDSATVDALAFPGGTIYLTRGTIESARSEGELAGLISHEIAHVALRHGASQASKSYLSQAGIGALGGLPIEVTKIIGAIGGFGFNTIFLKYSAEAEDEANSLGAQILMRAGYNPCDLSNFFQSLRRRARGEAPKLKTFLEDHPGNQDEVSQPEQKDDVTSQRHESQRSGEDFQNIQSYIAGLPVSSDPAPAVRRGPTVMEEASSANPAMNVRIERPSSRSREYWQPGGFWFQVTYPENWKAYPSGDKLGVTFVPNGGVIEARGQTQLIYGAAINRYRPIGDNSVWTGLKRRSFRYIGGRGNLVEATNDLLDSLLQNNPYLDFSRGSDRRVTNGGLAAITLTLTGRSPLTGRGERVQIYTRELDNGDVIYALFAAPDDDYGDFRPAFEKMLRGLKIDDGSLQRGR